METVGFLGMAVDMAYSVYNGATIQSVTVKASKGVKKKPGKGSVRGRMVALTARMVALTICQARARGLGMNTCPHIETLQNFPVKCNALFMVLSCP